MRSLLGIVLSLTSVFAVAEDPIHTGWFNNLALEGYDTVAYFKEGRPVEGDAQYSTEWMGAEWRFSSAENLDAFVAKPEAYAPQYGGYCAWAVAQGKLAAGDPEQWEIVDGRLFVNYNRKIQERWLADRDAFIIEGDKNWPGVIQ
ncbi:MAG: YHS domain-containing (seleno)protein [Pseudomonadota bacterium]